MPDSFSEIKERLTPVLRKIIARLNKDQTFLDEEDLFQESVMFLWKKYVQHGLDGKTDSYLLQACNFHLKNSLRLKRNQSNSTKHEELNEALEIPDPNQEVIHDGNGLNISKFGGIEVLQGNQLLTQKDKKIIEHIAAGLTMREIGKKFKVSHVAIIKMIKKIREKLKSSDTENG